MAGAGVRWDVALSFAGAQREYVGRVAAALKARGVRCFYDADEQVRLWGAHLAEELPRIYAQESAAVVVFISADYAAGSWTRLECRAAFSRAVTEAGVFVLPARFDDSELPGLIPDVVTVDLRRHTPEQFAGVIAAKLADLTGSDGSAAGGPAAGRLLSGVTDPFDLEVHRPVQAGDAPPGLSALPTYVPREHDEVLGQVVRVAAGGASGVAVLVGGSSAGKTRACWEALGLLREQDPGWRLWHPIDPSRPEAALRELPAVGPRTVVWLNEAQLYLDVAAVGMGERVAAGLRQLLRERDRGPVLVLATLWPEFWARLTARPPAGEEDPHAQARELLAGRDIPVPAAFTPAQLQQLTRAGDPRLALAAAAAGNGQVTQFLAGAPELLARYRNAPPTAVALITAAIDARRLGMGVALPAAFLEAAAPGYLTDADWDGLGEDWLERAFAYTAAPANGIRGPLSRIRPRAVGGAIPDSGPVYRLADYLEQHGRRTRRGHIPQAGFWRAAARFAAAADLPALAAAAEARGLCRDAARLRKHATAHGDTSQAAALVRQWHSLDPLSPDPNPARWAAAHADLDDPNSVASLLYALQGAEAEEQVAVLLARDPASHVGLDEPWAVTSLLLALREAGAGEQAAKLADRAAAEAALDNLSGVARLLDALREAGAEEQVAALAGRAAAAALDDPYGVALLLDALRRAGADHQVAALAGRAAAAALDDLSGVTSLLYALCGAGAGEQAAELADRAAAGGDLDDPNGIASLLHALREAGAEEQAAVLIARDPAAHATLDDPDGVARLLHALREAGVEEQAAVLIARDPAAHATLDDPFAVTALLEALRNAGAEEQATALLGRATALDDLSAVTALLDAMRDAGAEEQVAALLAHAPHPPLDNPGGVGWLLAALRDAGADEQAKVLVGRLPAEGRFDLFLREAGHEARYRFGREADGSPAPPWGWDDLD